MKKSKIKNQKIAILLIIINMFAIFSCSKIENTNINNVKQKNAPSSSRINRGIDTFDFLMNVDNPTREVRDFIRNGNYLPATRSIKIGDREPTKAEEQQMALVVNPTYPNYHCCNDICLTIPEDPYGFYQPFTDIWGNPIKFIGRYGNDPRQMYYVYIPNNVSSNAKIIVLIHGGGWITGPDPDKVNGFNSTYCNEGTESTNNIVKNLLSAGYVVVAPLYRLVAGADNNADDLLSPVTVLDQVNDIDAAITHVRTNFPTCLWQTGPINANNIQVLGESAGANLALLFAYTKANTSYVKSVVSVAGPANMNNFASWIQNKQLTMPCLTTQTAQNDFKYGDPIAYPTKVHFPKYSIYDPDALNDPANTNITNLTNPQSFNCWINIVKSYSLVYIFGFPVDVYTSITNPLNPPGPYAGLTNAPAHNITKRVNDSYHAAQYCTRSIITNPATNNNLQLISPSFVLNSSRIVPTFIIYGNSDWLVPYSIAMLNMNTKLTNFGGLIGTYNSTNNNIQININYTTHPSKHIIKIFSSDGAPAFGHANHNVAQHLQAQGNILNWFSQH